jgi:hypothetical protein
MNTPPPTPDKPCVASLEPVLGPLLKRGLTLSLTDRGTIHAAPKERLDDTCRALLRENRDAIIAVLREAEESQAHIALLGSVRRKATTAAAPLTAPEMDEETHTAAIVELVRAARAKELPANAGLVLGPGRVVDEPNFFVRCAADYLRMLRRLYGEGYMERATAEDAMNDLTLVAVWWQHRHASVAQQKRPETSAKAENVTPSLACAQDTALDEELVLCS